jgi:hypothetical protein
MAWVYESAYQHGQSVTVTLRLADPNRLSPEEHKFDLVRYPNESVAEFTARGQNMIADRLRGLNTRYNNEVDRTAAFQPPGAKP